MQRIYRIIGAAGIVVAIELAAPARLALAADTTLLDLENSASMPYTFYSYNFTAQYTQTYLTFEFRQDPSYWYLDDVSFTAAASPSTPLIQNGGFENGSYGSQATPNSWTLIGQAGLSAGGRVANSCAHSGNYCYRDGAVGGVDGLFQSAATTVGQTYTLSFWLRGNGGSPASALVQVGTSLDNGGVLQPPSGATNIVAIGSPYLAANLGSTVNPIFDGGTLKLDASGPNFAQNFTVNSTNGTIDAAGLVSTLSGVLSGPGGLTFTNSGSGGSITLTGVNTYAGSTTVNTGTVLALAGLGSISNSGGVIDNGTFDISGTASGASIMSLAGSGTVALAAQSLTLTNAAGTFSGALYGSGGLNVDGGTETLSGANAYSGATTIASGATLSLAGNASIAASSSLVDNGVLDLSGSAFGAAVSGFSGSGNVTLGNNSLIIVGGTATFAGVISGNGSIAVAGGAETLTGTNTFLGGTTVSSGATLALAGSGSIATSAGVVDNGTFDISATTNGASISTLTGNGTTVLGSQTLTLTGAGTTFAGVIGGTGGLDIEAGNQTLSGVNTYSGATHIGSAAALTLSGAGSIAASSGVADDGLLDLSTTTSGASITSLSGAGSVVLGTGTLTLTQGADVFSGWITGSGNVVIAGGTETLTGVNSYTGSTTVDAGATLALSGNGSLGGSSGVNVAGTLSLVGLAGDTALQRLSGGGTVQLGANSLFLNAAADTFGGVLGGSGGLVIGAGSETLTGVNTYTGTTSIAAGAALVLSGNGSISASSSVNDGGSLDISTSTSDVTLQSLSGGGNVTLGVRTLLLSNAADTFGGAISGTGGLSVEAGSETLSGANTYTGNTTVATAATLLLSGTGSLTASRVIDNGTFDVSAATAAVSITSLAGSGAVNLGANSLTLTQASDVFSGSIGGGGAVTVNAGTQTLTGTSTYSGGTTVANGARLIVNGDAALGAATGGVTLDQGTLETTTSMSSARGIALAGTNGIDIDSGTALALNGQISGNGHLNKIGDGTLTLAGDNRNWGSASDSTLGGLTIDGGLVEVTNSYGLGYGNVVVNGGTLATTVNILTAQAVQLTGDVTLEVDANTTTTLMGTLQSSGSGTCFQKTGGGTLNIVGSATLANGTCIVAGQLSANGTLVGSVSVAQGATLRGTGTITGAVTVGGTLAPGNSPGTLNVNGTVTMTTGSTYEEDINGTGAGSGPGNYSRLLVTGSGNQFIATGAALAPNLTAITGTATYVPYVPQVGETFRIITADGGIVGQFSSLLQPTGLSAATRFAIFYDIDGSNSVDLRVVPLSYESYVQAQGLNRNAQQAAGALDRLVDGDLNGTSSAAQVDLLNAVSSLNAQQLRSTATALAGEVHGELAAAAPLAGEWLQRSVIRQLQTGGPAERNTAAQPGDALWFDSGANHANRTGDDAASGFTVNRWQLAAGFDAYASDVARVGLGYTHSQSNVSDNLSAGDIEQNLGFLYGQYALAGAVVDALAAYGSSTWDTHRGDPLGNAGTLSSHADGKTTLASLGVRLPLRMRNFMLEPYARVLWEKMTRDAFAENAAIDALDAPEYSSNGTRLSAGLGGGSALQGALSAPFTYRFDVGVAHDSNALSHPTTAATLASEQTSIYSPNIGRFVAIADVGATARMLTHGYIYLNLSAESRNEESADLGGDLGVRWKF